MKLEFIIIAIQRIKKDSPEFFKKLERALLILLLLDGMLYGLLVFNLIKLPAETLYNLRHACYAFATFVSGAFFTSSMSVKDEDKTNI